MLLRSAEGKPSSPRFLGSCTRLVRAGDGEAASGWVRLERLRGWRRRLPLEEPRRGGPVRPRGSGPREGGRAGAAGLSRCPCRHGGGRAGGGRRVVLGRVSTFDFTWWLDATQTGTHPWSREPSHPLSHSQVRRGVHARPWPRTLIFWCLFGLVARPRASGPRPMALTGHGRR